MKSDKKIVEMINELTAVVKHLNSNINFYDLFQIDKKIDKINSMNNKINDIIYKENIKEI